MLLSFVFKDSQQQHCLFRNMVIECHVQSDLSCPAQEPIKLPFQVFARYFTFLLTISIRTARQLTNQIRETMNSM